MRISETAMSFRMLDRPHIQPALIWRCAISPATRG